MKSLKEKFSQRKYQVLGLVSVIIVFGAVLYVSQNFEGLRSFALITRSEATQRCKAYGNSWYSVVSNRSTTGYSCARSSTITIPQSSSSDPFFNGQDYCQNKGSGYRYVPAVPADPFSAGSPAKCVGVQYRAIPDSASTTPPSSDTPTPTPPPATTQSSSMTITPKSGTAQVGQAFSQDFTATGGRGLNRWKTTSTVDNGLSFVSDTTGARLVGIPLAAGYRIISIEVMDYDGGSVGKVEYALTINNADGTQPTGNPPPGFASNLNPPGSSGNNTTNSSSADVGKAFYNPITINSIPEFIVRIINILLLLTGMLAVLFIIIGGLRYITSSGNPQAATAAKNTILYAILGLTFAVLSYAIVNVLTNVLINK